MSWSDLSSWWLQEIETDPAYEAVVTPLLLEVLSPRAEEAYLDVGSGEGRVMRSVSASGAAVVGLELNEELGRQAGYRTVVASVGEAPFRGDSFDGAYAVLVLEHLKETTPFFTETARMVKAGGVLAIVSNHPTWTAPESTPIQDEDGEILWRPGHYFSQGSTEVPIEGGVVTFYHRAMAEVLNTAAEAGWSLQRMMERPHHEDEIQPGIPRLLACRWSLLP